LYQAYQQLYDLWNVLPSYKVRVLSELYSVSIIMH